jgi:RNA polymerase sigma-70 factor (ECF subfamily)
MVTRPEGLHKTQGANGRPSRSAVKPFDCEWALALLEKVFVRLRDECVAAGKGGQFEQLRLFLTAGKGALSHADAAKSLGMDEDVVRTAVHRLRKRYRQLLRDEIAQTLSNPAMVDEEMQALFGAFGN